MITYLIGVVVALVAITYCDDKEKKSDQANWWQKLLMIVFWPVAFGVLIGEIAHKTLKK